MTKLNYEDWIKNAMRSGLTADEIAKGFTEAMNAINSEYAAKKKKNEEIRNYMDSLSDLFDDTPLSKLDTKVVAAIATYAAYNNPATKDWTLDKFKSYGVMITEMLNESIEVHNAFENMLNGLSAILNPDDRDNFLESM